MSDGKVEDFIPYLGVERKLCIANQKDKLKQNYEMKFQKKKVEKKKLILKKY